MVYSVDVVRRSTFRCLTQVSKEAVMHTQTQLQKIAVATPAITPDQVRVFAGNTSLGVPLWEPAFKALNRLGLNPNTVTIDIDAGTGELTITDPNDPVPFTVNPGRWHLTN